MASLPQQTNPELGRSGDSEAENAPPVCMKCEKHIYDGTILKVKGDYWHNSCLQCVICRRVLDGYCYAKDGDVYCATDFTRLFGAKCANCGRIIAATEAVRVANDNVYHTACFTCSVCSNAIKTGDYFFVREDRKLLCKNDSQQFVESEETANLPGSAASTHPRQSSSMTHDVSRDATHQRQSETNIPVCQLYCPLDYLIPDGMPPNVDLSSADFLDGEVVPAKQNNPYSFEGNFTGIGHQHIDVSVRFPSMRPNIQPQMLCN